MEIQYRKGKEHQNADSLSRIPNESGTTEDEEIEEDAVIFLTFREFPTEQALVEYCTTVHGILLAQDRQRDEATVGIKDEFTQDRHSLRSCLEIPDKIHDRSTHARSDCRNSNANIYRFNYSREWRTRKDSD
jgi:hypothetical protein